MTNLKSTTLKYNTFGSTSSPTALLLTRHDHRYASRLRHGGADRTEQHAGESAAAVATDDDQLSPLGLVEQMAGRGAQTRPNGGP